MIRSLITNTVRTGSRWRQPGSIWRTGGPFSSFSSSIQNDDDQFSGRKDTNQNRNEILDDPDEDDDVDFSKPPNITPQKSKSETDNKEQKDDILPNFENSEHPPELSLRAARYLFAKVRPSSMVKFFFSLLCRTLS